jgi:hypothetical protein
MVTPAARAVVLVPFPFSDLSQAKLLPRTEGGGEARCPLLVFGSLTTSLSRTSGVNQGAPPPGQDFLTTVRQQTYGWRGLLFSGTMEMIRFSGRGTLRTLPPGRTQVNIIKTRKCEHSRKPNERSDLLAACSPGPYQAKFGVSQRSSTSALARQRSRVSPALLA